MKKLIILASLVVFLMCSCMSIPDPLTVLPSDGVEVSVDRGTTVGTVRNGDVTFSLTGNNIDEGEGSFVVGITNNSASKYNFDDADIIVWGGFSENERNWKLLKTWDAGEYYSDAQRALRSQIFWTGFIGVMDTINAATSSYSTTYYVDTIGGPGAFVTTYSYDPGAAIAASYIADVNMRNVKRDGKEYLTYLENHLLFDSTVNAGESYAGWVFFADSRDKFTYYRVDVRNSDTQAYSTFILKREMKGQ